MIGKPRQPHMSRRLQDRIVRTDIAHEAGNMIAIVRQCEVTEFLVSPVSYSAKCSGANYQSGVI